MSGGGPVPDARRLRVSDLGRVAGVGLRTRKLRAALSALGVAIGVAAIGVAAIVADRGGELGWSA